MAKAQEDLTAAGVLIDAAAPCAYVIAFHCQQSAEKFLKAYLTQLQIEFPKTHDIGRLLDIVSGLDAATAQRLREADALSDFGVDIRYPDDMPDLNPEAVKQAFATALDVRATVLALLAPDPDPFADPPR